MNIVSKLVPVPVCPFIRAKNIDKITSAEPIQVCCVFVEFVFGKKMLYLGGKTKPIEEVSGRTRGVKNRQLLKVRPEM